MNTNYGPCPNFLYCDASTKGVGLGTPCLPGTYAQTQSLSAITTCTPTVAGSYSNTVAGISYATDADHTSPTMTKALCAEGYYCKASVGTNPGNSTPKNATTYCGVGEKCVAGATAVASCPAGTFQFNKAQG